MNMQDICKIDRKTVLKILNVIYRVSQKSCNNPRKFFLISSQCCQSKDFELVTKLQSLASSVEKMKLIALTVFKI